MATFPLHRPLTFLAMLGAVALLVITWAKIVSTISNAQPVTSKTEPSAIVWADRVFSDRASLRRWLHSRGLSYRAWSSRHPQQAAILERRPVPQPTTTEAKGPMSKPKPAKPVAAAPRETSSGSRADVVRDVVFTFLLTLALVLAAAAALPAPLRRRFPALAYRVAQYRGAMAATAASIVLGIAVSVGLS